MDSLLFKGLNSFKLLICYNQSRRAANITYKTNFGDLPCGDITLETTHKNISKNFDILCAGFPCQAFSIAGYRKGFSDTRGTLFFEIEKIAEKYRPKVLFLENVKNLLSHNQGKTFQIILEILEQRLGYHVYFQVLNSMKYANIPQNRERIFLVAFDICQVSKYNQFKFPEPIKLTKTIHNILEKEKQNDYFYYQKEHKYYPQLQEKIISKDTLYQWRRVYVRENKNNVCPTLTANMGTGGHNVPIIKDDFGIRKLTPRECFSFQGFPSNFILPNIAKSKLYMQAGNSVTLPLIERIGAEIIKIL